MAHYVLFTLGGVMIYLIVEELQIKHKMIIAIFFGMLFACLDEYHQFYSKGRGPSVLDVGLDTLGIISGVIIAIIGLKIIKPLKKGKKVYDKFQKNNCGKKCKSS